jgi:hypothetical protein
MRISCLLLLHADLVTQAVGIDRIDAGADAGIAAA